jgi:probable blue pigment (indigoidine) exporter
MALSASRRRHVLALILAALCWGVGTVISKQAVAEIPPLTLLVAQLAVSVGFLSLVARRRGEHLPGGRDGRRLARLGLLNPGLAYALSLLGLAQISASLSVLLWALEPVLTLVLAVLLLRERPGAAVVGLSGVTVGGLVLVLDDPARTRRSASIAAMSFYLIPVFGVAAPTLFGDRLAPIQRVGAVVVAIAVGAVTVRTAAAGAPAAPAG